MTDFGEIISNLFLSAIEVDDDSVDFMLYLCVYEYVGEMRKELAIMALYFMDSTMGRIEKICIIIHLIHDFLHAFNSTQMILCSLKHLLAEYGYLNRFLSREISLTKFVYFLLRNLFLKIKHFIII